MKCTQVNLFHNNRYCPKDTRAVVIPNYEICFMRDLLPYEVIFFCFSWVDCKVNANISRKLIWFLFRLVTKQQFSFQNLFISDCLQKCTNVHEKKFKLSMSREKSE